MVKKTTTRYRDRESGRFVSKATWNRSKAHGGTRYMRERVPFPIPEKVKPLAEHLAYMKEIEREIAREEEFEEYDIEFGVDYTA